MEGYTTIQQIAEDLYEHPLLRDVSIDRMVSYVYELIRIVGNPKLFVDKIASVEIKNYRGALPCDCVKVVQIRGNCGEEFVPTMDNFHTMPTGGFVGEATYKVQGNVIITSVENGEVEVAYRAMELDDDGFPLIPDNATFIRALKSYIKMKRFTIHFDMGKIQAQVMAKAEKDYNLDIRQAEGEFDMPSEDEMETLTRLNTLIPRVSEHRNGFATTHNRELIRRH